MEDKLVCCFKLAANVVGGVWQFVYDTSILGKRSGGIVCEWQLAGGGETVFIHMVQKGTAGFSNVKNITLIN